MQTNLLQENLHVLKTQYQSFYNALMSREFSHPDLKLSETDQPGNYTIQCNNTTCTLHSGYNIDREMRELFKPLENDDNQVILIFGLGYGYCLDYIKKKRIKYKKVVFFEPYNNILMEVLKKRTLKDIFGRPNVFVHLFKLPNEMASLLFQETLGSKNVKLLFHLSYRTIFKDLYDNVLRTFRNEKTSVNTSISTFSYFSTEWNKHQIKSLKKSTLSASILSGRFKNIPGIIASAGPSLGKHFDLLQAIEHRAVIVSPGTSSRIFNDQGIESHFAISTDSQIHQANIYKNYTLHSVLIGANRLHPKVADSFPNDILNIVLNTEFLSHYYNEWMNKNCLQLDDRASVASVAVDFLVTLGCNPIILIGQDLCYYDNKLYAGTRNNAVTGQYLNQFEDLDIYGNKVYTFSGFKAMQNDMELLNIKYRDKIKIYNATEGGLNIHGIENVKFQDLFDSTIKNNPNTVKETLKESLAEGKGSINGQEGKRVEDFYAHVLMECEAVESVLKDKAESFVKYEKLKAKNAKTNRLNSEMFYIRSFNKQIGRAHV